MNFLFFYDFGLESPRIISQTGTPQGTVLAPLHFTLYIYSRIQLQIWDLPHSEILGWHFHCGVCLEWTGELAKTFSNWSHENNLISKASKTKDMIVDFWRFRPPAVKVCRVGIEVVTKYKYLGLYLDNKLDWSLDTDKLYKKGKNHLFLLRKLRSLDISSKLLQEFCQPVVTSVLFYATWRGRIRKGMQRDWTN